MHVGIKLWKPEFAGMIADKQPRATGQIDHSLTRPAQTICAQRRDPAGKHSVVPSQRAAATRETLADALAYCGIDDVKCREGLAYNWFCGI